MKILQLIKELPKNPSLIKDLEQEINKIVETEDFSVLEELSLVKDPIVKFYLLKILELKIKSKKESLDLQKEINFINSYFSKNSPTYQMCEIYSLLGLYCWPNKMPDFYSNILLLLNKEVGYRILLLFLENVNSSTDIDANRRNELKKAIKIVLPEILSKFEEEQAEYIIQIMKELLKIVPHTFNYEIVFKKAVEYPDLSVSFFTELYKEIDLQKIIEILPTFPPNQNMIFLILSYKKIPEDISLYQYILKCTSNSEECFNLSLSFWTKVFLKPYKEKYINSVLIEVIKVYSSFTEENDSETSIHSLFNALCKNYSLSIILFLKEYGNSIKKNIVDNFLNKVSKSTENIKSLEVLHFNDVYLQTLLLYLLNDGSCVNFIDKLDLEEKDSCKLILAIFERFSIENSALEAFLHKIKETRNSKEIFAFINSKVGKYIDFDKSFTKDLAISYYYCLKYNKNYYLKFKNSFFEFFIESCPFDRCFSILNSIKDIPNEILSFMYENMDKWPYDHLMCFNNDLLVFLPQNYLNLYIQMEVLKFINDWLIIKDFKAYYSALKSLLNIFTLKNSEIPDVQNYLLDLLQIDSPIMMGRVLSLFCSGSYEFDTHKAVYNLISSYNLPNLVESQGNICSCLTKCLIKNDGPKFFNTVLNIDINKCEEVRNEILKTNKKNGQVLVKNLIKDFKAKSLTKLYQNTVKVSKQDLFKES